MVIPGGPGDDTLNGTGGDDLIEGFGGMDRLDGLGGNDTLKGGDDNDILSDYEGVNVFEGGAGDDIIVSRSTSSGQSITGGSGVDSIEFYFSADGTVDAGEGDDTLWMVDSSGASVTMGAGDDFVSVDRSSNVWISTGEGDDTVGQDGVEEFISGTFDLGEGDNILGLYVDDASIVAGAGADNINVITQGGAITISSGGGADRITYNGADDVDPGAPWSSIDAGEGDDTITASGLNWILLAGGGNDQVTIDEGAGTVTGDAGVDTYRIDPSSVVEITDFAAGADGDIIDLDYLLERMPAYQGGPPFTSGFATLVEEGGNTVLKVDSTGGGSFTTAATLVGVALASLTSYNLSGYNPDGSPVAGQSITANPVGGQVRGTQGNDTITGLGGNDRIDALNGNDLVNGGPGEDTIAGGLGDDILWGGDGDDFLIDIRGKNQFHGGAGDDLIVSQGGSAGQTAFGDDGNDTLRFANTIAATIDGGAGDDRVDLISVYDTVVRTRSGNDQVVFNSAQNITILGGAGDDEFVGNTNPSNSSQGLFDLGDGDNRIYALLRDSRVLSTTGNDTVDLWGDNLLVDTGGGSDEIYVAGERTTVRAGGGDDHVTLFVGRGSIVYDGEGEDLIEANEAKIVAALDGDNDDYRAALGVVSYSSALQAINSVAPGVIEGAEIGHDWVQAREVAGGAGNDTLSGYDRIVGNGGDDTIIAWRYASGGAGSDWIEGVDAGGTILGGDGDDVLFGSGLLFRDGEGSDMVDVTAASTIQAALDGDNDWFTGGTLKYEGATVGMVITTGSVSSSEIGTDTGLEYMDRLFTGEGDDSGVWAGTELYTRGGNDTVTAASEGTWDRPAQAATIDGGTGDDHLTLGKEGGKLIGGTGDDVLRFIGKGYPFGYDAEGSGGAGADVFEFEGEFTGLVRIWDFVSTGDVQDQLDLSDLAQASHLPYPTSVADAFATGYLTLYYSNGYTTLAIDNNAGFEGPEVDFSIRLKGIHQATTLYDNILI